MAATLADETNPGDVVLAHDGLTDRSMTVAALPLYLTALRQRSIEVVTLSQLEARAPVRTDAVLRAFGTRLASERWTGPALAAYGDE